MPFVPNRLSIGGIGLRVGAYIIDDLLFGLTYWVIYLVVLAVHSWNIATTDTFYDRHNILFLASGHALWLAYFTLMDGLRGGTIGKSLLGLHVTEIQRGGPPGIGRGVLRTLLFYLMTGLPLDLFAVLSEPLDVIEPGEVLLDAVSQFGTMTAIALVGYAMLISTMRVRNGFRGPHELLSGTRVVRLPMFRRRRAPRTRRPVRPAPLSARRPLGVLESVGPFQVRGAVRWDGDRKVLLGEDTTLKRQVWITMRPRREPPLPTSRHELSRSTRPRWLRGGEQVEGRWDAFIAPAGCPLSDLAGPDGLHWFEARPILEDLTEELTAARDDGTLPRVLTIDQVWVQPDGRALLVDALAPSPSDEPGQEAESADDRKCLEFLGKVAALALEGGRWRSGQRPSVIVAEVPRHVARIFDRLLGRAEPYEDLRALLADLHATRELPTEVNLTRRAMHLAVQAALLATGLAMMFSIAAQSRPMPEADRWFTVTWRSVWMVCVGWPLVWVVWGALARGGLSLHLLGMDLSRSDTRPAGRLRCGWRALLVWAPISGLLVGSVWTWINRPSWVVLPWMLWGGAGLLLVGFLALALLYPSRSWHDRLSGTLVVPK